jgi:hypothetical protein
MSVSASVSVRGASTDRLGLVSNATNLFQQAKWEASFLKRDCRLNALGFWLSNRLICVALVSRVLD